VVEVSISLQFRPIELLRSVHFGLFWDRLRPLGFEQAEDHGELPPVEEQFALNPSPQVGIKFETFNDAPPMPRVWFLNGPQNELVQLQRDRLIVNWRQGAGSAPYPRYANIIERFKAALTLFTEFLELENLGSLVPNQCEITYVNHILPGGEWRSHSEVSRIVTVWTDQYSDSYLGTPEDAAFFARYVMTDSRGESKGRLHVSAQPGFRRTDNLPILVLNLTARGAPSPASTEGVLSLFDKEHEWIVRGFTSITSDRMHKEWGIRDG
jgi:uncharacterized protein (TIGR04255 family)